MKKNISIIYFLLFVYSIANAQDSLYFRANAYKEQLDNYYSMDEKDFPKPGSILFIGLMAVHGSATIYTTINAW